MANLLKMWASSQKNTWVASYNPRYPGFNEEEYNKLKNMVSQKGLTWDEATQMMDQLYEFYSPQVLNKRKLDERQQVINEWVHQNSEALLNWQEDVNAQIKLTNLSQMAKWKFWIPYNIPDDQVIDDMVTWVDNWNKLLYDYVHKGSPELLYSAWIMDKTTQWWLKGRVAEASDNTKNNDFFPPVGELLINPLWYAAEVFDNGAKWAADKITVGKKARENLINKLGEMSPEDIEQYKQRYDQSWYNGSFQDYVIDLNKTRWQDLVGADEELKGIAEPNVFKFFGNMPASTLRLISSTVRASTNPVDTLVWLYHVVWNKEWRQALKDRYLTADGWANAMNYDSVGTAEEILSVAHSMWGLVKWFWHLSKLPWVEKFGTARANNIWSPFDVAVDRALYWGDITYGTPDNIKTTNVKWLYGAMDDLAWNNKVLWGINRYVQDTSSTTKLLENASSDLQAIKQKANSWANDLVQNNNRMTKKQQETFSEKYGEDQWKFMNDRDLRTQEDLVEYFIESKDKVDKAMESIEGRFTSDSLTKVLDEAVDYATKTESPDAGRLQNLQKKNASWWLDMSEINEVKRFYERNNKFDYQKNGTSEQVRLATNRDTALRNWQQKIAAENGLTNLKELNRETSAAKYLTDNAIDWQNGIKGNNPISLTDWIIVAWDWFTTKSLEWLVSKKVLTSPWFKDKVVDVLNYIGWHEKIAEINPDMNAIELKNHEKRILAEELAKVQTEQEFNAWLDKAQEMAGPALPYNPRYDGQAPIDYSNPTVVTPGWQSIRPGQISEIQ